MRIIILLAILFSSCSKPHKDIERPSEPSTSPSPKGTATYPSNPAVSPSPSPIPSPTPVPSVPTVPVTPPPSPSPSPTYSFTGEQGFKPYVTMFTDEAKRQNRALIWPILSIKFDDLSTYGANVLGLCSHDNVMSHMQYIRMSESHWKRLSDTSRMLLTFHELAHCVLRRDHSYKYFTHQGHQYPDSIMSPSLISETLFKNFEAYYLNELFSDKHSVLTIPMFID